MQWSQVVIVIFLANSCLILQIYHAKTFKMKYTKENLFYCQWISVVHIILFSFDQQETHYFSKKSWAEIWA